MNDTNRYAPPKAEVADFDTIPVQETAPALWNPNAAGLWSLLFSPVFGAILHMKNWQALGQPDKAAASKNWAIGSAIFIVIVAVLGGLFPKVRALDSLGTFGGTAVLIAWYYAIGKSQTGYVLARYGKEYPRRGWAKPLFAALGVFVAFVAAMGLLGMVFALVRR